jgi:hypothetical protein
MLQPTWTRTVLAAVIALALAAGVSYAQDFETTHPHFIDPNQPHPVLRLLHVPLPVACWASHNGFSCGSTRSEATFLWGSCRQFFGEPCLQGPPPAWSPEARIPPGVDAPSPGRRCNCGW